jgi:DNA-binding NtrC family response regulator
VLRLSDRLWISAVEKIARKLQEDPALRPGHQLVSNQTLGGPGCDADRGFRAIAEKAPIRGQKIGARVDMACGGSHPSEESMKKDDHDTISAPLLDGPSAIRADGVVALKERATGEIHELAPLRMRFSIGVGDGCDIALDDPYVSKHHCVLERRGPTRIVVKDTNSKNGVMIDGAGIEIGELRPGSLLRVGRTELLALSSRALSGSSTAAALIGEHPRLIDAVETATRAGAAGDCSVLILGETGTGKELFAQIVHEASARVDGPFIALNCGALSTELLGSELFGHVRGAFTGAIGDRSGVFVEATGGTLFLDEIGELPLEQQPHLLRVLETQRVRPVGSNNEREVDVRFVAATNRLDPLGAEVLRADLYHRIATVVIELPPLRDRRSDIPLLIREFVSRASSEERIIAPATMKALIAYPWPGNVRELLYAVQRAVALCDEELTLDTLLPEEARRAARIVGPEAGPTPDPESPEEPRSFFVQSRDILEVALEEHGSMRQAARALNIPRSTFADRLRRYRLKAG